ncbi:MAG: hypothetical protein IJ748_02185 [Bacteroidales bacterium]|nr:hypothetical protein [Bacteroidales bacterium]
MKSEENIKFSLKRFFLKLFSDKQLNVFVLCLLISFALWVSITYSKEYVYSEVFPISFSDSSNKVNFFTKDSVITVEIRTNGFEYLANQMFASHRKKVIIDVENLNLNLSKGEGKIPVSRLKPMIMKELGYETTGAKISPETILLKWNKVYSKKVPVVNRAKFLFDKPFEAYLPEVMLSDYALVEGAKEDLEKVDMLYTQSITFKNINKSSVFFVPLDLTKLKEGLTCKTTSVPVRVTAEKFTESTVNLPVSIHKYEDFKNIKLLPKEVTLRYRVAMKDYRKVNTKDWSAYVICSKQTMDKGSKLRVYTANIPDYIRIVSTVPEKVDYILYE